jgi:hypothetical protein
VAVLAGLPFGPRGVAIAVVVASSLLAVPSITYAGRPISIGAPLVIRAVGPQLIGAISSAAAGWWLQASMLADYSGFVRILLLGGFCTCIYRAIVVGLFRLIEPIRVADRIVQDLLRSDGGRSKQVSASGHFIARREAAIRIDVPQ